MLVDEDRLPNEYIETGEKYLSRTFNNLAILVFYCKLQLIQNILTNGLVPPTPPPRPITFRRDCMCEVKVEQLRIVVAKLL